MEITVSREEPQHQAPGWKTFLLMLVLVSLSPWRNLETDLQAGANHKYELLWVILIGLIFAFVIQSQLSANLGVTTGKHLAELCKEEYPTSVKYCLWLVAELAVIAADIPAVIGTAFALNILFHVPVWAVLLTGLSTLIYTAWITEIWGCIQIFLAESGFALLINIAVVSVSGTVQEQIT